MCGRYSIRTRMPLLEERFDLAPTGLELEPRSNLAPGQQGPVVITAGGGEDRRELKLMRWGLIPSWAKEARVGYKMINARAESVDRSPAFKRLFLNRRCLVLADGFYEWAKPARDQGRGGPVARLPFRFILKDGGAFAMAGLWDRWRGPEGVEVESYTIITTLANPLVARLHDRMPVILSPSAEAQWLDPGMAPWELKALLRPLEDKGMDCYRVSTLVNRAGNEGPELIRPIA